MLSSSSSSSSLKLSHRAILKLLVPTLQPDPFPIRSSNTFTTTSTTDRAQSQSQLHILTETFKLALTCSTPLNSNSYLNLAKAFTTKTKEDSIPHLLTFTSQLLKLTKPNPTFVINRLLFAFAHLKHPDTATILFNHIKTQPSFKPDIYTYNILMEITGRAARVGPMLHLFDNIKKNQCGTLRPDVVSYNTVMNHTRKFGGEVDVCLGLFEEMRGNGVEPDEVSYGVVIDALGRTGRVDEAMRLFGEMKARGGVRVHRYVYRAVIDSLRKMGKVDMAVELMEEMKGVGNGARWKKRRGR